MRLDALDELKEAAELFATCPLPAGAGVGLLSPSGGQIGLIADLAQELGLDFPPLSEKAAALEAILPPFGPIANPPDAWGSGDLEATYPPCVGEVSHEDDVHLLAVSRDSPADVAPREVEQSLAVAKAAVEAASETRKPVLLFSNLCAGFDPQVTAVLDQGGVPYRQGTRETLRAIQAFVHYGAFRYRRTETVETDCPSPATLPWWRK
jgi:acyl-CoA synthetase (NDP forming)